MTSSSRAARRTILLVAGLLAAVGGVVALRDEPAGAHGSTTTPASRQYACRFTDADNPMCQRAKARNPQSVYDWNGVNVANAAGRHEQVVPDGRLCSAGRPEFGAFDEPGDWPATPVSPGPYEVVYSATAPHATEYWRAYVTKAGFDARTDRPGWADLEQVYESGSSGRSDRPRFTVPLPERSGRHLLYLVWQRSDSGEAFYACSDLEFTGGSGAAGLPAPGEPSTGPLPPLADPSPAAASPGAGASPDPGASPGASASPGATPYAGGEPGTPYATGEPGTPYPTGSPGGSPTASPGAGMADPDSPTSMVAGVDVAVKLEQDWDRGACREYTVTNRTGGPVAWEVAVPLPHPTVTSRWDAVLTPMDGHAMARGVAWNEDLAAGRSTSFGFCATR